MNVTGPLILQPSNQTQFEGQPERTELVQLCLLFDASALHSVLIKLRHEVVGICHATLFGQDTCEMRQVHPPQHHFHKHAILRRIPRVVVLTRKQGSTAIGHDNNPVSLARRYMRTNTAFAPLNHSHGVGFPFKRVAGETLQLHSKHAAHSISLPGSPQGSNRLRSIVLQHHSGTKASEIGTWPSTPARLPCKRTVGMLYAPNTLELAY